jgi:hypothetical protein
MPDSVVRVEKSAQRLSAAIIIGIEYGGGFRHDHRAA